MAKTPPDFTRMMQDAMAAFSVDPARMQQAMRDAASQGERASQIALGAATRSADLSAQMVRDTLSQLEALSKARDTPQEYGEAMAEFARHQTEAMNQQANRFAEILRQVQDETAAVLTEAAQSVSGEAGEAVRKAAEGLRSGKPGGKS